MTKHLRRKKNLLLLAAIACLCLFGCFLFSMQTSLAVKNQVEHMQETVRQIPALVDNAYRSAEQNRLSYDEVYQSKAVTVAYMAARDSRFQTSNVLSPQSGLQNPGGQHYPAGQAGKCHCLCRFPDAGFHKEPLQPAADRL